MVFFTPGIMPGAAGTAQYVQAVGLRKRKLDYPSTCYYCGWMITLMTVCGGWGGRVSNHHSNARICQHKARAACNYKSLRESDHRHYQCMWGPTHKCNFPFQNNELVIMLNGGILLCVFISVL